MRNQLHAPGALPLEKNPLVLCQSKPEDVLQFIFNYLINCRLPDFETNSYFGMFSWEEGGLNCYYINKEHSIHLAFSHQIQSFSELSEILKFRSSFIIWNPESSGYCKLKLWGLETHAIHHPTIKLDNQSLRMKLPTRQIWLRNGVFSVVLLLELGQWECEEGCTYTQNLQICGRTPRVCQK